MGKFNEYINQWYSNRSEYLNKIYYYQIHLTKRCQNNCDHCYFREIGRSNVDIDIAALKRIINKIAINAQRLSLNPRIDFTGGDPFLYPFLEEAIVACRQNGIKYGFKCNPDFFIATKSDEILTLIHDCSEISLSLDGLEQCHDSWRGKGNFNKTIEAAGKIKEMNFYLRLNTTLSLGNLSNLIPLTDFLISEKIVIDDFTWARYWSLDNKESIIPASMLPYIFDEYSDYLTKLFERSDFYRINNEGGLVPTIFFGFKEHQWLPYFISKQYIFEAIADKILDANNCLNCTATKKIYIMDPDLKVYKCRKIPESVGGYLENSDDDCLFKIENSSLCTACRYYNCCGGCSAMSLSFTGNFNEIEPGCAFFQAF